MHFRTRLLSLLALWVLLATSCSAAGTDAPTTERLPDSTVAQPSYADETRREATTMPTPSARTDEGSGAAAVNRLVIPVNAPLAAAVELVEAEPVRSPQPGLLFQEWVQTIGSTDLFAGPGEGHVRFNDIPPRSYLKVLEVRPDWLLVVYGGDGETRLPGTAWVRSEDVGAAEALPGWAKNHDPAPLWSGPDELAAEFTILPSWSLLELMGHVENGRVLVRYPGDGRSRPPGSAWIEASYLGPTQSPLQHEIPRAYPYTTQSDVLRLPVPYLSQLDGTPWADANCGPTALSMALEAFDISRSSGELRRQVLNAQQLWGDWVGVYMEALVEVAEAHGARVVDLMQDGQRRQWSVDDVRRHVEEGRPVILQVRYRGLPGRENARYGGDHYIVVTGLVDTHFLYNDPIDSDGVGFDRLMTPAELNRAMDANDKRYKYAGFALDHS